ncbi:MAG: hypothetical protein PW790_03490 [Parvibaculaceae bacterium]|nr:hypothetical protein [Parvibaculaceae bacterium]
MTDDEFEPRLGKIRSRGQKGTKSFGHLLLAAINRAGGKQMRKPGASLRRIGRGGAAGAILGNRDHYAALRQRRVIVKARIVKLASKGMNGARAHLRYIQRTA